MTRARYSENESINRILRSLKGDVLNESPETLIGEVLSSNEAMSDIAEVLEGSLPGETGRVPYGLKSVGNVYSDSKFFFVDPNHPNRGDGNTGENPGYPLATVQAAVNKTRPYRGDSIFVTSNDSWQYGAGTQNSIIENVVVGPTHPGIGIYGVGIGGMGVYWLPAITTGTFALTIQALDVIVDGFTFWGTSIQGTHGIDCDWASPTTYGENSVIRNCIFTDDIGIGIRLDYTYFTKIYNNQFQECLEYGIYADPTNSASYGQILNNYFDDCAVAMSLVNVDHSLIKGNTIFNTNAQAAAVATDEGINTTSGAKNVIADNYFSCVLPAAANGDWNDLNTGAATDAWVGNHCLDGLAVTTPT